MGVWFVDSFSHDAYGPLIMSVPFSTLACFMLLGHATCFALFRSYVLGKFLGAPWDEVPVQARQGDG